MSDPQLLEKKDEDRKPIPTGKDARRKGLGAKIGRMLYDQAIPLLVGAISFVIAVDAWLSAKPLEWEQQRALASVSIASELIESGEGENTTVTTLSIENVGQLTFAILDMHVTVELSQELSADWTKNSLVQTAGAALPLGLRPFRISDDAAPTRTRFQFDEENPTWHVVDPGRTVEITFVQPTTGSGWMSISANVFTQPMLLGDVADDITVDELIDGVLRPTLPEYGTGEVSEFPIFPYSSGHILVIPKTPQ